jgi:DNA polymerase III epsilon subunit-like protein
MPHRPVAISDLAKIAGVGKSRQPEKKPATPDWRMQTDSRSLAGARFVAFDIETTGLNQHVADIMEIGAVCLDLSHEPGVARAEVVELVKPRQRCSVEAFEKHQISSAMVANAASIAEVLPRFLGLCGNDETILVAHNSGFDGNIVGLAMRLCGIPYTDHAIVDTMSLARRFVPGLRCEGKPSLELTARALGISWTPEHRALADARVTVEIFEKLLVLGGEAVKTRADLFVAGRGRRFSDAPAVGSVGAKYESLARSAESGTTIELQYPDHDTGKIRPRSVTPLWFTRDRKSLVALCDESGDRKFFKLDRVQGCQL